MTELLTSAQMRAVEQAAIESGAVTGLALMERAGRGVVAAIFEQWPELQAGRGAGPSGSPEYFGQEKARRAVVLCGPGNNGGDGFVVARLLQGKGWAVEVLFYGDAARLPPDAARMYGLWSAQGAVAGMDVAAAGARPDLLVDAMFGTGASRAIALECAQAFQAVRRRKGRGRCRVVAVDCPSGMDCDSGEILLPVPPFGDNDADIAGFAAFMQDEVTPRLLGCDLCVTFHRAKVGHFLAEVGGGAPVVVDIGLKPVESRDPALLGVAISDPAVVRLVAPQIVEGSRAARVWLRHVAHIGGGGHKYDRGHALVLGGGVGRGGAARMAARAALRIGAGLVTLGVPGAALQENAARMDAVMLRCVGSAEELVPVLADGRLAALCLGPGLGVGARTRDMVRAALSASAIEDGHETRRFVLDADALSSFADDPAELFALCHDRVVLTPHEGEFARLFADLSQKSRVQEGRSKVDDARRAARRAGCYVVLKGEATVIAGPDGAASVHPALYDRRAPWLGTAGAGDVLAGMICGVLAHRMGGFAIHQALEAAVWLHVECARSFGPGLIAEDLPEELPRVFRGLGV
mgnify:CR=1 FL=1